MVESQPSKLIMRVRSSLPAPQRGMNMFKEIGKWIGIVFDWVTHVFAWLAIGLWVVIQCSDTLQAKAVEEKQDFNSLAISGLVILAIRRS